MRTCSSCHRVSLRRRLRSSSVLLCSVTPDALIVEFPTTLNTPSIPTNCTIPLKLTSDDSNKGCVKGQYNKHGCIPLYKCGYQAEGYMRVEFATIGKGHGERKRNIAPLPRRDPVTTSVA